MSIYCKGIMHLLLVLTVVFGQFGFVKYGTAQQTAVSVDTWDCLPVETAFAARIPDGKQFMDHFVENTKLGSVIFSEQRKAKITKTLAKADDEDWNKVKQQLNEYGLKPEDLLKFLAGETGYAVVLDNSGDETVALGLAWLEPGEDLAGRAVEIIAMAVEDQAEAEYPIARTDVELGGQEVMQLSIPNVKTEYTEEFEYPEGYEDMGDAEREAAWDEAYKKWEDSAEKQVSYGNVLFARAGERLLFAHSFKTAKDPDNHPEAERLAALFAQLLESHESGGGGFVEKYSADALTAEVMAIEGIPFIELVGDSEALIGLAMQAAENKEVAGQIGRVVGIDSLGMFAMKSSVNGNLWESQLSYSIEKPREGLMKLIEQETVDLTPPDWIPASAIRYSQISFDLGAAYETIKEIVTQEFPDQANMFGIADMQVFGFAQASIQDILKSLGTQHIAAAFKAEGEVNLEAGLNLQNPDASAVVWQVSDEQIWSRILKSVTPFIESANGAEVTDEQGYNGIRIKSEAMEVGVFLGNANLVLGVGSGVIEKTLSSLNNPPEGEDAFRGGEIYERAADMLDISEGIGCDVIDGGRYAIVLRNWLTSILDQVDQATSSRRGSSEQEAMEIIRSLMPSEDEVENIFGVGVSRYDHSDEGVRMISIQEVPPPDED